MKRLAPLALLVVAAGCGGSAGQTAPAPTATVPATVATAPSTPAGGAALPELRRIDVSGKRVVFTFSARVAHARARWVDELHADASGTVVPVNGGAVLVIRFEPARAHAYTGPTRVSAKGPVLEVVRGGDFEGLVTWAIGLDTQRSYRVTRSGPRVIVSFGL